MTMFATRRSSSELLTPDSLRKTVPLADAWLNVGNGYTLVSELLEPRVQGSRAEKLCRNLRYVDNVAKIDRLLQASDSTLGLCNQQCQQTTYIIMCDFFNWVIEIIRYVNKSSFAEVVQCCSRSAVDQSTSKAEDPGGNLESVNIGIQ